MQSRDSQLLSPEQMLLQTATVKFLAEECPLERVKELTENNAPYDRSLWVKMAQQGLLGLILPESSGGLAYGLVELAVLGEEMGKACLPGPFIANLQASCLLNRVDSKKILSEISGGQVILSAACPVNGSDQITPFKLDAHPNGDGYRLNGSSSQVLDAEQSDQLIILAINPEGETTLLIVARDTSGVTLTRIPSLDQMRPQFSLHCHDVVVGRVNILAVGEAVESASTYAEAVAGIAATADIVGTMQWILETAQEFTDNRQKLGQNIHAFRDVPERCGDLLAELANTRSALHSAAAALQNGMTDAVPMVAQARDGAADIVAKLGELLIQRQEGMGLTFEHDLHLFRSIPPYFNSIS